MIDYQFMWHDGGRADAGYTGHARDCAARAIAIATGEPYQSTYESITTLQGSSPRNGTSCSETLLEERGWKQEYCESVAELPTNRGVLIVRLATMRSAHLATIVGNTLYDTWDCLAARNQDLKSFWWHPQYAQANNDNLPTVAVRCRVRARHDGEFQKALNRIRKLKATATNAAATEGEVENALRAIQAMLLKHNLSMDEISEDKASMPEGFTNQYVTVNGKNSCNWEAELARFVTQEVFPLVNYFKSRSDKRTVLWFYGPVDDVEQCIELYRELLLTIATAAKVQYGSFRQGSGASYAEGFVAGLPSSSQHETPSGDKHSTTSSQLVIRAQQMQVIARNWLRDECDIRLSSSTTYGRSSFDGAAHARGKQDGAQHDVGNQTKRLTHHR